MQRKSENTGSYLNYYFTRIVSEDTHKSPQGWNKILWNWHKIKTEIKVLTKIFVGELPLSEEGFLVFLLLQVRVRCIQEAGVPALPVGNKHTFNQPKEKIVANGLFHPYTRSRQKVIHHGFWQNKADPSKKPGPVEKIWIIVHNAKSQAD